MSGSITTILSSVGQIAYRLAYEISPIILVDGIAAQIPGKLLPIVAITEAANFGLGLLNGALDIDLDQFFAHFWPEAGSTLYDVQLGKYPFANQAIAANAIIAQPLRLSVRMECPVQTQGGYTSKLITMSALVAVLKKHAQMGGLYTVATPAQLYTSLVLLRIVDISGENQAQSRYRWEFEAPLITQQQAQQAQNNLMSTLSNGGATDGSWSGGGAGASTVPGSNGLLDAGGSDTSAAGFVYQAPTVTPVSSVALP